MKKCSSKLHNNISAISYCQECKILMCNKCVKLHSELFDNHNIFKIEEGKDINEIFTGICKEENHNCELKYFCKTHNVLCCAECITTIKDKENGKHKDCKVCLIQNIEEEKKNNLKNNIKILEESSINLNKIIDELKILYEKINESKENIKKEIQKEFTKYRNLLNEREIELLSEVDMKYNNFFCDEKIIRQTEKIPAEIKISLEKGKLIDTKWKNNKLNSSIYECLKIENYISEINNITKNIKAFNSNNSKIRFLKNKEFEITEGIREFGILTNNIFDSNIEFDEALIRSWLNNKNFTPKLLFRKSVDGSTPKDFHDKCDNKGITIVFIETTKGYKFGGYTELGWDCNSGYLTDENSFLFSFNHKEKYTPKNNNNNTMCCDEKTGPWFGNNFPEIILRDLNKGRSWNDPKNTFVEGQKLTNGEEYWDVKEIEVFQINYI